MNLPRIFLIDEYFRASRASIFPLGPIKLCSKLVRTSPWGTRTVFTELFWFLYG